MSDVHLLIEEQIPRLMRYARALTRDNEAAAELVEDTVREALAHPHERRPDQAARLWLLGVLHDLRDNPFRQGAIPADPFDRDPLAALTLSDLDRALGQLPEQQRAVILLIGLEGLSYGESAAVLRLSVGTLRARLARARAALRETLGVAAPPARPSAQLEPHAA